MLLTGVIRLDNISEVYCRRNAKICYPFIANRVAIIQEESEPRQWRHVRSEHNPADHAS